MLIRILIILFVLFIIIQALGWLAKFLLARKLNSLFKNQPPKEPEEDTPQKMVRCHHCGIYVPQNNALEYKGKIFCSEEHAKQKTDSP